MPDKDLLWRVGPWVVGVIASIIGVAVRNEYTTRHLNNAVFDREGDVKLMPKQDCETCRANCRAAVDAAMLVHSQNLEKEHKEVREELHRVHEKLDHLPQRIIQLLRTGGT